MTYPRREIAVSILIVAIAMLVSGGCRQKMADQPSFRTDEPASFLPEGTSSLRPVAGTVPRGHLQTDLALFTGKLTANIPAPPAAMKNSSASNNGSAQTLLAAEMADFRNVVDTFPIPIDESVVEHGYHRYMIYCVVCHDALGTGHGKIVERGYTRPPSYHIDRLRNAPVGHFFRVITEGYGSMPSYAAQIPVRDRWAIVAYVRALQLSQHYPADEAPRESASASDNSAARSSLQTEAPP